MAEDSPDHDNNRAAYWRGETNARLKAVEDATHDLKNDIRQAGEFTRLLMEKNKEELGKTLTLLEARMDVRITSITAGLDDVKKEVYKILGKAALLGAILLPFIIFILQRLFPVKAP